MLCPNCKSQLTPKTFGPISVDHCTACGASFFDENEINRLTLAQAQQLAADKTQDMLSGQEKLCPRDSVPMQPMVQESIPQFVTLLKCKTCGGIFVYGDDLVHFKKAQHSLVDYYKAWQRPLPTLKAVLVYTFVTVLSVTVIVGAYYVTGKPKPTVTNAESICARLETTPTENGVLVFCQTETPLRSRIEARCESKTIVTIVNKSDSTAHLVTIPVNCATYRFIFTSGTSEIQTEFRSIPQDTH